MKCIEFKYRIQEFTYDSLLTEEMKLHLENCKECADEYRQISKSTNLLKPRVKIEADPGMKDSIINQLRKNENMETKNNKSLMTKRIIAIAASLLIIVSLLGIFGSDYIGLASSSQAAARNIFTSSLDALSKVKNMYIKLKVRTIEHDNFDLIGSEFPFVEHEIVKSFSQPEKWKIEKAERAVAFDGKEQYLFIKNVEFAVKADGKAGFVGWLKRLLNPEELFGKELANVRDCSDCSYEVDKSGDNLVLTIKTKAQGNFDNSWTKNSSVEESDSRIVYSFSKDDFLLKDLQVYIMVDDKEILVIDIEKIVYNEALADNSFEIKLPAGVEWRSMVEAEAEKEVINLYKDISCREAAEIWLKALTKKDWKTVEVFFPALGLMSDEKSKEMKGYLGNLEVITIGEAFQSGLFAGYFVPCEVKLADGSHKSWNLALRNDNKNKLWEVDGGF